MEGEREKGPVFVAAYLPSLKLLLIKQSGANEAGPFRAPCRDQRRLSGGAGGLAHRVGVPGAGGLPGARR